MHTKRTLRREYRRLREHLDPVEAAEGSRIIQGHVLALDVFRDADAIFAYHAAKPNEVDTARIIAAAFAAHKPVCLPRVTGPGAMDWRRVDTLAGLVPGRYGIPEPPPDAPAAPTPTGATAVLVPGLAFTPQGGRLGMGGGYFDRFLANFPGVSIGLCHERQLIDTLPLEAHDAAVDWVVTETRARDAARRRS